MTGSDQPVDVLIIGAGPAGLAAALWLSYLGIKSRIIDRRPSTPRLGQADGLNPRSMEILQSFGIDNEVTQLWEPATDETLWIRAADGGIVRKERYRPLHPAGVKWTHGTLQQGVIEELMKKKITEISSLKVEHATVVSGLDVKLSEIAEPNAYPCSVDIHKVGSDLDNAPHERIRARYVIGADGGRSWTRKTLGFTMEGSKGDSVWGVMDFAGVSDFPDFRAYTVIRCDVDGAVDFVRREDNLMRVYVQMNKGPRWEHVTRESITPELIIEKTQYMLRPYKFEVRHYPWWSTFSAAQNLSSGMSKHDRVFLAGDAVHTHSPLTGMGMNISMQDSYNLAWKLAGVIKKQLSPNILHTYETERRPVAKSLIEGDQTILQFFNYKLGLEPEWLLKKVSEVGLFLAGREIYYTDPLLTSHSIKSPSNIKLVPGDCFPEITMSNHATAKVYNIQSVLKIDGSWPVIFFAGDVSKPAQMKRANSVAAAIERMQTDIHRSSFLTFNNLLVHCAERTVVELADFHELFFPEHELTGRDYEKVFLDDDVYEETGFSREDGGLVLLRPDRYIGWFGGLDDLDDLKQYLERIIPHECRA